MFISAALGCGRRKRAVTGTSVILWKSSFTPSLLQAGNQFWDGSPSGGALPEPACSPPQGGRGPRPGLEGPPSTHPAVPPAAAPSASFHVRRVPGTAEAPGYCSDPNRPRSCSLGISVSLGRESQETVSKGERIIRRKISKGGGQKGVACPLQWLEQHLPALTRDPSRYVDHKAPRGRTQHPRGLVMNQTCFLQ